MKQQIPRLMWRWIQRIKRLQFYIHREERGCGRILSFNFHLFVPGSIQNLRNRILLNLFNIIIRILFQSALFNTFWIFYTYIGTEDSSSNTPFYQFVRIKSISAASQYLQHQTKRSFSNNVILYFWSLKTSTLSPCSFWETEKRSLPRFLRGKERKPLSTCRKKGRQAFSARANVPYNNPDEKKRKEGRKETSFDAHSWNACLAILRLEDAFTISGIYRTGAFFLRKSVQIPRGNPSRPSLSSSLLSAVLSLGINWAPVPWDYRGSSSFVHKYI